MFIYDDIYNQREIHLALICIFGIDNWRKSNEASYITYNFDDTAPFNTKYPYYLLEYSSDRKKIAKINPNKVYDNIQDYDYFIEFEEDIPKLKKLIVYNTRRNYNNIMINLD